jgi:hypothetical protein
LNLGGNGETNSIPFQIVFLEWNGMDLEFVLGQKSILGINGAGILENWSRSGTV